ncbi:hypothetical protein [Leptospira interrogans]|uniref:hypothetical protein n=1 Tax=Leptospira interrogans TaxID=173 RepID=UPI0009E1A89B|nr:hypothetical protein [Leptospira interrogans]
MDRGLSPKRAINLPPAFLTPSIQEYHIRNCLTFKKHTNLWIVFETSENASRHSGSRCIEFFIRPNFQLSKLTLFTISKTK